MGEPSVLVADDDALARRFFVEALASLGVDAAEAGSGAEALLMLERTRFDALLADLRMPGPAGAELAEAVRRRPGAPRLFAMSGELDGALRERLVDAGYADAFQKPISRAALSTILGLGGVPQPEAGTGAAADLAVLDDAAARVALGSDATVAAMRGLLHKDLPAQRAALDDDVRAGRHDSAAALLHRLKAACAFCGATRLAAATTALQRALERRTTAVEALHRAWDEAATELEAALAQR